MLMRKRKEENEGSYATGGPKSRDVITESKQKARRDGEHEEGSDVLGQMTVNPWQVVASAGRLLGRFFFCKPNPSTSKPTKYAPLRIHLPEVPP